MTEKRTRFSRSSLILGVILATGGLLYYVAIAPQRFGRGHDDTVYLTTAKALATGEGYRIISLPFEPSQTKYPPVYPLLLSLAWRLYPSFPENLPWMMLLSAVLAVGFLGVSHRYLVKDGYATARQSLIAVGLAAVNWRFVILATSLYTEMLYGVLSVSVLYLAEKFEKKKSWIGESAVAVLIGLALLTRNVGVSLLAAVCVYYAMRREWRKSLWVGGIGSLFVIGWFVWCYANRTTVEGINVAYYTNYFRDVNETITSMQANNDAPKLLVFAGVLAKNALALILLSVPVVCLGISYESVVYFGFAFIFVAAGFVKQARKGLRLLHIYMLFYLVVNLPIPFSSYDRYLMPLLPFLLFFFVSELEALAFMVRKQLTQKGQLANRIGAAFIGLALVVAVCIALYNYGSETYSRLEASSIIKSTKPAPEDVEVLRWISENTSPSDVLICYRDPLYYLYTGRQGTQSVFFRYGAYVEPTQAAIDERVPIILRIINENNGRYLVINPSDFDSEFQPDLQRQSLTVFAEQHPQIFVPVFRSSDNRSAVFRVENTTVPSSAVN